MAAKKSSDPVLAANAALLGALGCQQREAPELGILETHAKVQGVDADVLKEFEQWKVGKKIDAAMRGVSSPEEAKKTMMGLYKEGLRPTSGGSAVNFWYLVAQAAIDAKDSKLAKTGLEHFMKIGKEVGPSGARFESAIKKIKDGIEALGGKKKDG